MLLVVLAGCTPSPAGTFTGDLVETRNISITTAREGDTATVRRLGGGATEQGVRVTVTETGDDQYALTLRGCDLTLHAEEGGALRTDELTTCTLALDGWTGAFGVQGHGTVGDGRLHLDLIGSATGPDAAGGFGWTFRGTREP